MGKKNVSRSENIKGLPSRSLFIYFVRHGKRYRNLMKDQVCKIHIIKGRECNNRGLYGLIESAEILKKSERLL